MRNTLRIVATVVLATAFVLTALPAMSAVKKKAPAKRIVLGTKQLNGDQAELGLTYTLGKTAPLNVTLNSAEYSVEPIRYGKNYIVPKADEKLLVLHYTLHNPNPRDFGLRWSTFNINAVDSKDTNWRYNTSVGMEATNEMCNMSLKPGQKTKVYTAITVPAKGEIPKVMFESGDRLVLRYDFRGKAKPLPAPIADPSDASGATALEKAPAQMGIFYRTRLLRTKLDSVAFTTEPVKGRAPKAGTRYLTIIGTMKNETVNNFGVAWSTIKPRLLDADGAEIRWDGNTFYASRDDNVNTTLEPGQELRFRHVFTVPEKVGLGSIAWTENGGRAFVYDLTQVK